MIGINVIMYDIKHITYLHFTIYNIKNDIILYFRG